MARLLVAAVLTYSDPLVSDLPRFPNQADAMDACASLAEERAWVEVCGQLGGLGYAHYWALRLAVAEKYDLWYDLAECWDFLAENTPCNRACCRVRLARLRHNLGGESYRAGRMPRPSVLGFYGY